MEPKSLFVEAAGLRLHALEAGSGEPVLLLHGIPTSAQLWRALMPAIARRRRVLALDLPGFGHSDKPLDVRYSTRFYDGVLDGFCDALGLEKLALVVHDFGGPVGLHWALARPERISQLALLNTLVYPETSWAVKAFVLATKLPLVSSWLASPSGISAALRLGVQRRERLTPEVLELYHEPFRTADARRAMVRACGAVGPGALTRIAARLPALEIPVRCIYGAQDRILPDVARTMARVKSDLPQAELTALPDCGHFLQEDAPEQVGELLAAFLA